MIKALLAFVILSPIFLAQSEAQTVELPVSLEKSIASALVDQKVIFALGSMLSPEKFESVKTYLDIPVDNQDNSHAYLVSQLFLTLIEPSAVLSPDAKLPEVLHIVGTDAAPVISDSEGEATFIQTGPLFLNPSEKWLLLLLPVESCAPETCGHLQKFQANGFTFHTLYDQGRAAFKITAQQPNPDRTVTPELVSDLQILLSSRASLPALTEAVKASLMAKLTTEKGRIILGFLPEAKPLKSVALSGLPEAPAAGVPPATPACSSGSDACPKSHLDDTATCIPKP